MRGTKPEQISERSDESLNALHLELPREKRDEPRAEETKPASQFVKPEVVQRFEEIMQQELSGTSISVDIDRHIEAEEELLKAAQRGPSLTSARSKPLAGAKPIRGRAGQSRNPFQGVTILDKVMSFVAHLLKIIEQRLFGGRKKFDPKKPQQRSAAPRLKPLTEREKQALKKRRSGYRRFFGGR